MPKIKAFVKVVAILIGWAVAITALIILIKAVEVRGRNEDQIENLDSKIELQQDIQSVLRKANVSGKQQLSETLSELDLAISQVNQLTAQEIWFTEELRVSGDVLGERNQELEDLEGKVVLLGDLEGERDALAAELEAKKAEEEAAKIAAKEEAARKAAEEAARQSAPAPVAPTVMSYQGVSPLAEPANCPHGESFTGNVSGYSSTLDQTWGDPFTTATGTRVHWGTVAVDPNHIPYGCRLLIDGFPDTIFVAEDTGGAILGHWNRIDIWFPTRIKALNWGRQLLTVTVL